MPLDAHIDSTSGFCYLEVEQSRLMEIVKREETKIKDTSVGNQIVWAPHIEVNKEMRKFGSSSTIVVSSTDTPTGLSGETPSPTPKLVPDNNTSSSSKGKWIKDTSLDIEVSPDEVIEMVRLDLTNIALEKTILLQEIMAKKKKQEELRRQHKQKKALYDVKNIFVEPFDIQNFDGEASIVNKLINIVEYINGGDIWSNESSWIGYQEDLRIRLWIKFLQWFPRRKLIYKSRYRIW